MKKEEASGKPALDLIEEAIHLLRIAPLGLLCTYYIGSIPFILAFLYFWGDMSRGPFAGGHLAESAFVISLLYIWMKSWQSIFANQVYSRILNETDFRLSMGQIFRLAVTQLIVQPYIFFLLPISFLAMLPFGWVYSFFQNLSLTGNGEDLDLRRILRRTWQLASIWPGQNHRLIPIVWLFGFFLWINVAVTIIFIPQLLKMLFGIETIFTLSGIHILNTTFLTIVCGVCYLILNPLVKTVYVLRCFYADSRHSGTDLLVDLKSIAQTVTR